VQMYYTLLQSMSKANWNRALTYRLYAPAVKTPFQQIPSSRWHVSICVLLITWLANSLKQSLPWEFDSCSAYQEILRVLLKAKVHYRLHKSTPLVTILSHISPVHILKPIILRFSLILFCNVRFVSKVVSLQDSQLKLYVVYISHFPHAWCVSYSS
jgi:hypothetical protein